MQKPSVGRIVHYVSYGTPGGEYTSECRAAVVTEVGDDPAVVSLAVLKPTGMFFNQTVPYHDGSGNPGSPDCPNAGAHENGPLRYCGERECGWTEPSPRGGTWHWPERVD